jgi:hypothetical protein
MSDASTAGPQASPQGHRVSLGALLFGFAAAPIAWIGQLLLNYGFSSYVCFPKSVPLSEPMVGWRWITPALFGLDALALILTIAGAVVSWRAFALTRDEHKGDHHHLIEVGEGRSRFLALSGLMTAGGFFLIVLFNTISLILVPLCAR